MISSLLLLCSIATPIIAFQRAVPAIQAIVPRATYIGGWPLALDGTGGSCPDLAPVQCDSGSSSLNTECCPSGQSCIASALITAYCCPSDTDCKTSVTNFPVCANSTWDMFEFSFGFFCCEPGTIAVIPLSGYGGLCVPSDQAVPKSQLASSASQVGAVATSVKTSPSATSPSSSQETSEGTSLTGTSSGGSPGATTTGGTRSGSSPTGTSNPAASDANTPSEKSDSKSSPVLSPGAIAGIVIGGLAIILLAGIFWALMRRRKMPRQPEIQYMPAPTPGVTELPPTVGRKPVPHAMATSMYSGASPGGQSPSGYSSPPHYGSEAPERYDPPVGQSPGNTYNGGNSPYNNYSEMEGPGGVQRAELRGDHMGH